MKSTAGSSRLSWPASGAKPLEPFAPISSTRPGWLRTDIAIPGLPTGRRRKSADRAENDSGDCRPQPLVDRRLSGGIRNRIRKPADPLDLDRHHISRSEELSGFAGEPHSTRGPGRDNHSRPQGQ